MIRALAFSFLVVMGMAFSGCGGTEAFDTLAMRAFNASPDGPALDILIGDDFIALGVGYGEASTIQLIASGGRPAAVNEAGTQSGLVSEILSLPQNRSLTYYVLGFQASLQTLVIQNDRQVNDLDDTELRVLNLAPSSAGFDVYITAPGDGIAAVSPDFTALLFTEDTDYFVLGIEDVRVRLTEPGTKTVLVDTGAVSQGVVDIRTIVVLDAPGGGAPFGFTLVKDNP